MEIDINFLFITKRKLQKRNIFTSFFLCCSVVFEIAYDLLRIKFAQLKIGCCNRMTSLWRQVV